MILCITQFFVSNTYKSPKYLMGHDKDEVALKTICIVGVDNTQTSYLSLEQLKGADEL